MLNPNIRDHARIEGFTLYLYIVGGAHELHVYVKPDTDLDSQFHAIDAETGHNVRVRGWLFVVEAFEYINAA